MTPRNSLLRLAAFVALGSHLACSGNEITSPSASGVWRAPDPTAQTELADAKPLSAGQDEQFNCTHLVERHVRFSEPGFAEGASVGLYYDYVGAPAGTKTLEIFWDEVGEPTNAERLQLGTGEVDRDDDTSFRVRGIAEHVYTNVNESTEKRVRANFIVGGLTGNCATVRRVIVSPDVSPSCVQASFDSVAVGTPVNSVAIGGVTFAGPAGTSVETAATVVPFNSLTGNFLIEFNTPGPLMIMFDSPKQSYRFRFAVAAGPATLNVAGLLGGATVFNASFPSTVPPGFGNGEGEASGAGVVFDSLILTSTTLIAIDALSACP